MLAEFGGGIAAPSANRFGRVSPTTARHVADDLGDAVDLILDGGACDVGIESTIVAFTSREPMLLRPGAIAADAIATVLGRMPAAADATAPRAPGTLNAHYAPRTPATLVAHDALRAELAQLEERDERVAVLAWSVEPPEALDGLWIAAPRDALAYARALYANLRALDAANADAILIEQVPDDDGVGRDPRPARARDVRRRRRSRLTAGACPGLFTRPPPLRAHARLKDRATRSTRPQSPRSRHPASRNAGPAVPAADRFPSASPRRGL